MMRDKRSRSEHFTKMIRNTMESEAWRELSAGSQALYPWLKLEWRGPDFNNNGKIRLSVRQAAERLGMHRNTVSKAFHELQAKGFIVVTKPARLRLSGDGKSPLYEITELAMPNSNLPGGRKLFKEWKRGNDFAVHKTMANNPLGKNGSRKNPVIRFQTITS